MTTIDFEVNKNTIREFKKLLDRLKLDPHIPTITEWAEKKRYLPDGVTENPGMWEASFVPYAIEIQENLHLDSPVRITTIMKSTQSLMTTTIENAIGHSIDYGLHSILYVISALDMAKMRSSAAFDPLINHAGLQERIKHISFRKGQKKSADTSLYKELAGGRRLLLTSYNSISDLKSFSWDFIIMDELDEAPPTIKDQGDPEEIIIKRGQTIDNLKVVKISTPKSIDVSRIWKAFKSGDQREYMIPCPRCGGYQYLEIRKEHRDYGLYGEYSIDNRNRASLLEDSVRYKCKLCGKDFFEKEKESFMLEKSLGGLAYWEAQAEAQDPRDRSYHISAMMSPMTKWYNIISDFLKTDFGKNIKAHENFVITNEGLPFVKNRNYKPWEILKERAEDYQLGVPPEGVLIIVGGLDVHKRWLGLHLVGYGHEMEAWSFDYKTFEGTVADINDKIWQDVKDYCEKRFSVEGIPDELEIARIAVDISYNPNQDKTLDNETLKRETNAAVKFCKKNKKFIAIKGLAEEKFDATQGIARKTNSKQGIDMYLVAVSAIKDEIFNNIDYVEGAWAIHFSKHYDDEIFRQFLSEVWEEDATGKMGYKRIYANHVFDSFIYSRVAVETLGMSVWTAAQWDDYKMMLLQYDPDEYENE